MPDSIGPRGRLASRSTVALIPALAVLAASFLVSDAPTAADQGVSLSPVAQLGAQLFVDPNLSRNRTQSCATCHSPDHAFTDPRPTAVGRAVSAGDTAGALGDRNTPTLMYASMTPPFTRHPDGKATGGLFWDGRADTLEEQAKGPLLNPVEMNMPDSAAVAARIAENAAYVESFRRLFGEDVFASPDRTLRAVTDALAAYQRTPEFAPFDSKYDRVMRGEEKFTVQEEFGRQVFLTWNCQLCHRPLRNGGSFQTELFTSFEYHNIGLPVHAAVRASSGMGDGYVDRGLGNAQPGNPEWSGLFKVATLRNVAVTGPYMHNGVFKELRTAIEFYNKYTSRSPAAQINRETGEKWGDPEVPENISLTQLKSGLVLNDARIEALEAFLKTLTDRRYEHLLEK